ncbi:MAG: FmdE family protein [Candidatus Magnetoovum sp. WYHC-5]|nr:FmdE family protein [Candidatus Magnetoovum sp. WYHC-5]
MTMNEDLIMAVEFHGHLCPGIAYGVRAAQIAIKELIEKRAEDEEIVAIVENDSCAVDAIQALTGCTFGKGNLIFKDYGKQVYTFIKRPSGEAIRIALTWEPPPETPEEQCLWQRHMKGDISPEVIKCIQERKTKKVNLIMEVAESELFTVDKFTTILPKTARIFPSIKCAMCGEKVMEPRSRVKNGQIVCLPCFEDE